MYLYHARRMLRSIARIASLGAASNESVPIQVKKENEWGAVCDDAFDIKDAQVICRQLGYKQLFGPPLGPLLLGCVKLAVHRAHELKRQCKANETCNYSFFTWPKNKAPLWLLDKSRL